MRKTALVLKKRIFAVFIYTLMLICEHGNFHYQETGISAS